jgi:polyphenol oxidase
MTTRAGGVSAGPFASLNLGLSVGDDPLAVAANRERVAATFGVPLARIMRLDQVHGTVVRVAGVDPVGSEGDAVVSDDPTWLLAVSAADCLPVVLHDPDSGAVAAAHAGWRGAVAGVLPAVVRTLRERYGTEPGALRVWFGAAIRGARYQVGPEVADAFERAEAPADAVWPDPGVPGRFRADVASLVRAQLERAGVRAANLHDSGACTASEGRWFSHRRDAGTTGRHWALVRAAPGYPIGA